MIADNRFIAKSGAGAVVAWSQQKAGHYLLRAVDGAGQLDSLEVVVEFIN
jgi:membrane carboxypeptidase/penicillin-binding protein PbpC